MFTQSSKFKAQVVSVVLLALSSSLAFAAPLSAGPSGTGGGDDYTVDFVATANISLYPWLKTNGASLKPKVSAADFLLSIDPGKIVSAKHVFESCDGTDNGREVAACYNATTGMTTLSRTLYPIKDASTPAKLRLIAHEVFRKMGIEGDQYEVSRQMSILKDQPPQRAKLWACSGNFYVNSIYLGSFNDSNYPSQEEARQAISEACMKSGYHPGVCQALSDSKEVTLCKLR